jgi:hypothetical protein
MLELYPEIKLVHVTAAIASGSLFLLRGIAINWGGSWGIARPACAARYLLTINYVDRFQFCDRQKVYLKKSMSL